MKKALSTVVLLALTVGGLSACSKKIDYSKVAQPTVQEMRRTYIKALRHAGVQVVRLGETMRFVLPSDELFNPDSANVQKDYRSTLRALATLMNTYDKVDVKVVAYTDSEGIMKRQRALTTRQAEQVASFLWNRGIDTRLEVAVGGARINPVASDESVAGRAANRRVEVSFRYYPESTPYA